MIRLSNVTKHIGEGSSRIDILRGVDLQVDRGEVLGILGPSGAGKTTVLNLIAGVDRASSGEIDVNGCSLPEMNRREITVTTIFPPFAPRAERRVFL